jgi:transposase
VRVTPHLRFARLDATRHELTAHALPKSPLGEALRYLDRQWIALQRFLEDGTLIIDNNNAERQLRTVAVGRRNWLFAGSMAGAHRAALLYSLIQSCRLAGVPPFEYLRDVLPRVATHPHHAVRQLTPKGWAAAFGARAAA